MARHYKIRRNSNSPTAVLVLLSIASIYTKQFSEEQIQFLFSAIRIIVAITILSLAYVIYSSIRKRLGARRLSILKVDSMSGVQFEYFVAALLRQRGFKKVRVTERYDLGIDIVAKKNGITWGIQTKRHNNMVRVAAVRQAYTALSHYKCDRAMVVANNAFSNPAEILARETNTVLVGREQLAKWI